MSETCNKSQQIVPGILISHYATLSLPFGLGLIEYSWAFMDFGNVVLVL
jgi:hypothetical protein